MRMRFVLMLMTVSAAFAADWAQWRGPNFNGSTDEKELPAALDPNQTLLWKTALPGKSAGTPVITEGRVYLTSTENGSDRLLAMCLEATSGQILWQYAAATATQRLGSGNTMASSSPCADAGGAVFMFGDGTLVRLDTAGKEVWKRNIVEEYGPLALDFGYSSSPLLLEGRLYISVMRRLQARSGGDRDSPLDSYLLCVNAADGTTIFKQVRPSDAVEETTNAYTTPLPLTIGGRMQVVVYGSDCVTGHDPQTGTELWRYTYVVQKQRNDRQIPTPVVAEGVLVCAYPRGTRTFGLDVEKLAAGEPPQLWTLDRAGSDITSAAVYQGALYQIAERDKVLTCLDPKTGTVHWTGQLDKSDMYYASITAADGKLYIVNRKGAVTIAAADPTAFKILSTQNYDEATVDSSIAIADKRVYLRTAENLYCFGTKE
jgi:outer membrane protein assembly factor BamB